MSRLARLLLGTALCLVVASCATSGRMWRISPLSKDAEPDRVNLWPLAYHNGDQTSVLWPLFDVDDKGFALRPLVAKEDANWSILWPYAAFNTERGQGWIFPLYRFENNEGVFPVANLGPFSYVGPVWWTTKAGRTRSGGLFPVAGFGEFNYVGPVWWLKDGGQFGDAGLFPLAMFGPLNYVGPVWWSRGWDSHGIFPLYGHDLFGSGVQHVGPAWWETGDDGLLSAGLFPLLSFGDGGNRFMVLPLYSHRLEPGTRTRNVLFGLGHWSREGERRESWVVPFWYHRVDADAKDTVLLPFFWKRTRGDRAQVYTLLGHRRVDPESKSLSVYPLWWSNEGADETWRMLFPLFYYSRNQDERMLITPLGGRGWSESGDTAFTNFLGPVFHRSVSKRRDEAHTAFLWPLFERVRKGGETTTRVVPLYSATSSPEGSEGWWGLGLGHYERDASGMSHRLWPLYSWSGRDEHPGLFYDVTLFSRQRRGDTTKRRLFPLYASRTTPTETQVDAALGLVHYREDRATAAPEKEWWIWPLISHRAGVSTPGFLSELTLVGSRTWNGGRHFHIGTSLLYSDEKRTSAAATAHHRRILAFYTHDREERTAPLVPSGPRTHPANRTYRNSHRFLFGAFRSERETFRVWSDPEVTEAQSHALSSWALRFDEGTAREHQEQRARDVLATHDAAPPADDPAALRRAIDEFATTGTESLDHRRVRIPLVYGYERTGEDVDWYGPLWLLRSRKRPDHAKFSFLYYAYRSERKGEYTTRDVFPFITWDSGPDATRFSFLWRVLHFARQGARRGGHVLFIPWGDSRVRRRALE